MKELKRTFKELPVTASLLSLMLVVFLAMQVLRFGTTTSAQTVYDFGGIFGLALAHQPSELWRLVSPLFVHVGWEHLLLNGAFLYLLGRQMELFLGKWAFLRVFLLSGVMGNLLAALLSPDTVTAGASGGLYGLSALIGVWYFYAKKPYLRQQGQIQLGFLLSGLIMSLVAPGVSLAGHLGGALGGALCAVAFPIPGEQPVFSPLKRSLALALYLLLALGMMLVLIG